MGEVGVGVGLSPSMVAWICIIGFALPLIETGRNDDS